MARWPVRCSVPRWFILLAAEGCIHTGAAAKCVCAPQRYSYAVFLTHHVIVRLVENFDLAAMTRRIPRSYFTAFTFWPLPRQSALFSLDAWVRNSAVKHKQTE